MRAILIGLAAVVMVQTAGAAGPSVSVRGVAPGSATTRQVMVPYGDLNMANRSDAEKLLARITQAAAQVCTPTRMNTMGQAGDIARCESWAVTAAVDKVDAPELRAVAKAAR